MAENLCMPDTSGLNVTSLLCLLSCIIVIGGEGEGGDKAGTGCG